MGVSYGQCRLGSDGNIGLRICRMVGTRVCMRGGDCAVVQGFSFNATMIGRYFIKG